MPFVINRADERRAFKHIRDLCKEVRKEVFHAGWQSAKEYEKLVKEGIGKTTQPWFVPDKWEPLSDAWKAVKRWHVEQFWIETAGIYHSIRTETLKNVLLAIEIFAGIRKGTDPEAFHRALINEYGFVPGTKEGHGVPRPLFGPAADAFSKKKGNNQRYLIEGSRPKLLFQAVVKTAIRRVYG